MTLGDMRRKRGLDGGSYMSHGPDFNFEGFLLQIDLANGLGMPLSTCFVQQSYRCSLCGRNVVGSGGTAGAVC